MATAEPFIRDWVSEVERQTRRSVRLVVASPADITRYTAEFFALAKSVRNAIKNYGQSGFSSFEQLVELGKSNKQLDANDQGVVQVVDCCGSTRSTSAPATSTWSHGASRA